MSENGVVKGVNPEILGEYSVKSYAAGVDLSVDQAGRPLISVGRPVDLGEEVAQARQENKRAGAWRHYGADHGDFSQRTNNERTDMEVILNNWNNL